MKNIYFKFIFLLGLLVMMLEGCNDPKDTGCIYNDPRLCDPAYVDSIKNAGGGGVDTIAFNEDLTNYDEKILLEEFTGFRCTNCPTAAANASNLKDQYPDQLFLSAIHCTEIFAGPISPANDPEGEFQNDLRTPEGAEWYNYYNPPGLPDGLINRLGTENTATIPYPYWADRVAELVADNNPEVYVGITSLALNSDSTILTVKVTVKPLILTDDEYYINGMVVESGIITGQKKVGGEGVIHNYSQNHVFRRTSNGPWGTLAYHGDLNLDANTALKFQLSVELSKDWVLENCDVIVAISKESTREIIQVDEKHLTE